MHKRSSRALPQMFKGSSVLAINGSARIFVCHQPIDLRKGFQGLSVIVTDTLEEELLSNAYFAFINKGRDRIKILYFDGDGLAIWQKRLEKGRYPKQKQTCPLMNRRSFLMLMEGVVPKRVHKRLDLS